MGYMEARKSCTQNTNCPECAKAGISTAVGGIPGSKLFGRNFLRTLRRILVVVGVTLAGIVFCLYWAGPVALSIWTAHKLPDRARLVPQDLKDASVSPSAGDKLSYFGYEFELPWSDIDASRSKTTNVNQAVIIFRSGLQMSVTRLPPKETINGLASSHATPQTIAPFIASEFGVEATRSDYEFLRHLYNFTPEKMNRWALSPRPITESPCCSRLSPLHSYHGQTREFSIFAILNTLDFNKAAPTLAPSELC